jgi:hypothetical protein
LIWRAAPTRPSASRMIDLAGRTDEAFGLADD